MPKNAPYNSFEDTRHERNETFLDKGAYLHMRNVNIRKNTGVIKNLRETSGIKKQRRKTKEVFTKIGKYLPRWLWDADDSDKIKVKGK